MAATRSSCRTWPERRLNSAWRCDSAATRTSSRSGRGNRTSRTARSSSNRDSTSCADGFIWTAGTSRCARATSRGSRSCHVCRRSRPKSRRVSRGALRARLFLFVSEHHGEVQHLRGDARLRLLSHRWPPCPRVAVPHVHTASWDCWSCAETVDRATTVLQEDEEGTRPAARCLHWARHDSQVDARNLLRWQHPGSNQGKWYRENQAHRRCR